MQEKYSIERSQETDLVPTSFELDTGFRWLASSGRRWDPSEMETRHLFNTIRMIWNHSAPDHLQFKPFRRYMFSSFYSQEYFRDAVNALGAELSLREDMTAAQKRILREMGKRFEQYCAYRLEG